MGLPHFLLIIFFFSSFALSQSKLNIDYYKKTCPTYAEIIRDAVTNKQITSPTTAAATLRLFFHDCILNGCDASILITSNSFNKAERDADLNLSLPGDGFDVIVHAKTALELACPGVVSCADILSVATRDLVTMVGGPFYPVRLGRKDSLVSKASDVVPGKLPRPLMSMTEIIKIFEAKGFSVKDMVALSGAHTIGFSHCSEFANRIFKYSKTSDVDPSLNPRYAEGLKKACGNYKSNPTMAAFNDVMTPGKFDNMFFQNLPRGLGLLDSDRGLIVDERTKPFAELFAANQTAFFDAFAYAMEKLSRLDVKIGNNGEVRHRCDEFNSLKT